jgi:carboxyl-terminal processing protease
VKLLRGKPGTEVRLSVARSGGRAPLEMMVRREVIRINPVRAFLLRDGLAYLRLSSFQESAPARLAAELTKLYREQPGPRGVILDLRNNPGGLLNAAVASSALFLPEGASIGTTDGRTEDSKRRFDADAKDFLRAGERDLRTGLPAEARSVPLAVLVNRGSAAGTEFVAAALQDHKRGVIVGEKTFGIGSIQTILPLNRGRGLKLTTAYWVRPSGAKIEKEGVVPDVAVEGASAAPLDAPDPAKDAVLARAVAALKR